MQIKIDNSIIKWKDREELEKIIKILQDQLEKKKMLSVLEIQNILVSLAASYFQVHPDVIIGAVQNNSLVKMRAFLSYYLLENGYTLTTIGKALKRHHSSIINYSKNFEFKYNIKEYLKFKKHLNDNDTI